MNTRAALAGQGSVNVAPFPFWRVLVIAGIFAALVAWNPWIAIGAGAGLLIVASVLAWPEVATLVVCFLIYSNAAIVGVNYHGLPFFFGAFFPLLLLIPFAQRTLVEKRPVLVTPTLWLMVLYLFVQVIGTLFSLHPDIATEEVKEFVFEGLLLHFMLTNVVRTPETLRRMTWVLIFAGVFMGSISLLQQLTGSFDSDFGGFAQTSEKAFGTGKKTVGGEIGQFRLAGPIGEKNRYSQVMLMLLPLAMFRFWGERSRSLRLIALISAGVIGAGFVLAFSRGGAVAFVMMFAIMMFLRMIRMRQAVILAVLAGVLLAAMPQYMERLNTIPTVTRFFFGGSATVEQPDGAVKGRLTEMLAAVDIFIDHPVVGVGPGMFTYYSQDYGNELAIRRLKKGREAHNLFLDIAAEHGALGLLSFLGMLYVTLRSLIRARLANLKVRPDLAHLITAYMVAVIGYLTTGLFLHMSYARYFWFVLAAAAAAAHVGISVSQEKEPDLDQLVKGGA